MDSDGRHGHKAEEQARQVAAVLGLPDFVYVAELSLHRGSGSREVGDALLIANGRGAIVQVKSRAPDGRPDKAAEWVRKHLARAVRQGKGSARTIEMAHDRDEPVTVHPVRCSSLAPEIRDRFSVPLDQLAIGRWFHIVILEVPHAQGLEIEVPDDVFVVTLKDWRELHRAIRSVTGILEYASRIIDSDVNVPLGAERVRFQALVAADAEHSHAARRSTSRPWFTLDNLMDPMGAQLYRELVERVWPMDAEMPAVEPEEYRTVVELLDAVPPSIHVEVGRWILGKRRKLAQEGGSRSGGLAASDLPPIVYMCADEDAFPDVRDFDAELGLLTAVRAEQYADQTGAHRSALGIGQRVDPEGIDYRYVLVQNLNDVPVDLRANIEKRYGTGRFGPGPTLPS